MISLFCDICGQRMESDYSESVQVSFNSYSLKGCINGYKMKVGNMEREGNDLQLCTRCANRVVKQIDELWRFSNGVMTKEREQELFGDKKPPEDGEQ